MTTRLDSKNILRFPSVPENLARAESFVDEVCRELNLTEELYGNILVSITEAVNNAIFHGNRLDPSKTVELCFSTDEGKICFSVKDEGPGFDFNSIPDPTAPENLEKPTGRGVFLMKQLADEVRFHSNGTVVEVFFKS